MNTNPNYTFEPCVGYQGFISGAVNGEFRQGPRWNSPEFAGAYLKKQNKIKNYQEIF